MIRASVGMGLSVVCFAVVGCGDSGGGSGGAGTTSSSTSGATSGSMTTSSTTTTTTTTSSSGTTTSSTSTGTSGGCTEITAGTLANINGNAADTSANYSYGVATSQIGGAASDGLELDLFNGLDTLTVDIATDAKNNNPSTCEACGWVFQDGSGTTAPKIFYYVSGQLAVTVPPGGQAPLAQQPKYVQMTDVTFREVHLNTADDLHSGQIVPTGACLHLAQAASPPVP